MIQSSRYPYAKILLTFTFSPIATGLAVLLFLSVADTVKAADFWAIITRLLSVLFMGVFSTIIAVVVFGIPALVTGALVCLFKPAKTLTGVLSSAAIGAIVMGVTVLLFAQPSWETPALAAMTAAVAALWVLPKKHGRDPSITP